MNDENFTDEEILSFIQEARQQLLWGKFDILLKEGRVVNLTLSRNLKPNSQSKERMNHDYANNRR